MTSVRSTSRCLIEQQANNSLNMKTRHTKTKPVTNAEMKTKLAAAPIAVGKIGRTFARNIEFQEPRLSKNLALVERLREVGQRAGIGNGSLRRKRK
jgi:hypothetical protein